MLVMNEIQEFKFNQCGLQKLKEISKGTNWPVVYLIHDVIIFTLAKLQVQLHE